MCRLDTEMTQTFRSRNEQVADLTNCLTKDCSGFHRSTIEYTASSFIEEAEARGAAKERGKGAVELRPMSEARKDRTVILAKIHDDLFPRIYPWRKDL